MPPKASRELIEAVREEVLKELEIDQGSRTNADFSEIGITGLARYGSEVHQEFLPQLRWPRAAKIYQEMESNDPVVGSILHVCEQLIRRVTWKVVAASTSRADEEAREFLESCLDDMSTSWADTIAEILTMIPYGFAWHEEVYKTREGYGRNPRKRSKYIDGRIGWRRLPGRSQATIEGWIFDEQDDGNILAAIQVSPSDYKQRIIPIEKSLLFRPKYRYNNPEGRSLLRSAYRPWYFKKHIEEIEGIGIERDLAGLPVLITPEGVNIWHPDDVDATRLKNQAESLVRNIRRDENDGIVLPFGWELTLLSTGSARQFDTNAIINRYDQRIAITLLADIVMLGADKVGSFALAEVKQSLLGASLEAIVASMTEVFNRYAIPRLFRLNAFPGITDYPRLVPTKVVTPKLNEVARYVQSLAGAEMPLFPDTDLEEFFRGIAGMPPVSDDEEQRLEQLGENENAQDEANEEDPGGSNPITEPGDGRLTNEGNPQELR